jgi:hypothetical protein
MFSGREEWSTWIARFEAIARRYQWSEDEMLDQLLPRLEGPAAQFVFSQLQPWIINSYTDLVAELNCRFRVIETTGSLAAKFSRRSQKYGETIEDYAADLKRLYDKAHGHRDRRIRDEDLVRRFLDGLRDEEIRFEVEYHKEPRNIDEAVYQAVSLVQIRGLQRNNKRDGYQARRAYDTEVSSTPNRGFIDQGHYARPDSENGRGETQLSAEKEVELPLNGIGPTLAAEEWSQ